MRNDPEHGGFVHTHEAARNYIVWAGSVCVIFPELSVMDADAMIRTVDGISRRNMQDHRRRQDPIGRSA